MLADAYARDPERFVRQPPVPPELPTAAWINKPDDEGGRSLNSTTKRLNRLDRFRTCLPVLNLDSAAKVVRKLPLRMRFAVGARASFTGLLVDAKIATTARLVSLDLSGCRTAAPGS